MTDKEKIVKIIKQTKEYKISQEEWANLDVDEIADALIANGIGDIEAEKARAYKNGSWRILRGNYITGGGNPIWCCSICGFKAGSDMFKPKYKYCPNCGAKMQADKEGE
jgi:rubrerythrin